MNNTTKPLTHLPSEEIIYDNLLEQLGHQNLCGWVMVRSVPNPNICPSFFPLHWFDLPLLSLHFLSFSPSSLCRLPTQGRHLPHPSRNTLRACKLKLGIYFDSEAIILTTTPTMSMISLKKKPHIRGGGAVYVVFDVEEEKLLKSDTRTLLPQ